MKTSDFDYFLPKSLIAQDPVTPRDFCKLLIYDTKTDQVFHKFFYELPDFLRSNEDVLVLNRSKVVPARIIFHENGREREIFILKQLAMNTYEVLLRPAKTFHINMPVKIDDEVSCCLREVLTDGRRIVDFEVTEGLNLQEKLFSLGQMPLPPYIKNSTAKFEDYQTIYAREEGSKAAPTAGLHFTEKLLSKLSSSGIEIEEVLLHVGLGTFAPVAVDKVENHVMHYEEFEMPIETAERLNVAKKAGKRIIAVGTTAVRVLESSYKSGAGFVSGSSSTNIFIYPGSYSWKVVDGLITNFHLPKSTLLMLVASFLESKGVKNPVKKILSLYELAVANQYRFFSFGDAMLIV